MLVKLIKQTSSELILLEHWTRGAARCDTFTRRGAKMKWLIENKTNDFRRETHSVQQVALEFEKRQKFNINYTFFAFSAKRDSNPREKNQRFFSIWE